MSDAAPSPAIQEEAPPPVSAFRMALIAFAVLLVVGLLPRLTLGKHHLVGKPAPAFSLSVVHNGEPGSRLSLEAFRGRPVLLDFWATWCGPCRMEAPILSRVAQRYRDRGVVVIGVNTGDKPGLAGRFAEEEKLAYPVVYDDVGIGGDYGVQSLPTLVMIGRDGRVQAVRTGVVDESGLDALIAGAL
jgi:cytochrome c biogenesis protein CcmG, thiol:disulfide interchange protein DsbE